MKKPFLLTLAGILILDAWIFAYLYQGVSRYGLTPDIVLVLGVGAGLLHAFALLYLYRQIIEKNDGKQ